MTDLATDKIPFIPADERSASGSRLPVIEGELRRPPVSMLYRASLIVVSLAMIILPLIYLSVIGLCAYGLCLYATRMLNFDVYPNGGIQGALLLLTVYVAPLATGLALMLFLVKPLFAPRPEEGEAFSLNHADAPQLFALIGWICRSLDAPIPSRVDVNLGINAAARFRGGFRSLFGNDLSLEVGLPLAAGLNLGQFAGIIGHEYGHFSQGAAMRAGYVIRLINDWFYRVVYERDKWDRMLVGASEEEDQKLFFVALLYAARFGVWLGRRVLWLLMWLGLGLSSLLSRQMELDADLYEIRMCGSETFVANQRRLRQLELGAGIAEKQLVQKWKSERKLVDQLPSFIVSRADEIPADVQARHYSAQDKRRTRLFDFHPSDSERIRHAVAAAEPGIFHSTAPATNLFANFPELARRVTVAHYRDMIGKSFTEEMLIQAEKPPQPAELDPSLNEQHLISYFFGVATNLRPIFIAENKTLAVRQPDALAAAIRSNRAAMSRLLGDAGAACGKLLEADARSLHARQAAVLLQAGFQFDPADFQLDGTDFEGAETEAAQALHAANAAIHSFEEAARSRLADAIQLLHLCQALTVVPNARQLEEQAREWVWALSRLQPLFEPLLELRNDCAALEILLQYRRHSPGDNLAAVLEELATGIQDRINSLQQQTESIRYPFEHTAGQILVSQYLRNTAYHADMYELALLDAKSHIQKYVTLHQRLLAGLAGICEQVESAAVD